FLDAIVSQSPDKRYVLFTVSPLPDSGIYIGNELVYSYDRQTGIFLEHGTVNLTSVISAGVDRWFDTVVAFYAFGSCERCRYSIYLADVTRANSVIEAITSIS